MFRLCCFVDATLKSTLCQSGTPVIKEAAPYCTHCETVPVLFFSASMKDPSFCFLFFFVTLKCLRHVHAAITRLFLLFFSGARSIPLLPSLKDVLKKKKFKSEAGEILFRATECLLALFTVLFFFFNHSDVVL